MFCIPYWMVSMPPLFSNVKRIRMAPKTMMRTPMAVTMPCNVSAATYPGLNPQTRMPLTAQTSHASGIAFVAGHLMPTIRMSSHQNGQNRYHSKQFNGHNDSFTLDRIVKEEKKPSQKVSLYYVVFFPLVQALSTV